MVETVRWELAIPTWGVLFARVVARRARRTEAPGPADPDAGSPWWSPPTRLDARSTRVLALLCSLSLLGGYLGTLLTQTITYAAHEFGATKTAQASTLSAVRIGVLLSLLVVAASDRRGRRALLIVSAVGASLAGAAGALSPNLIVLGTTQTVARAFSTALALLVAVMAAEEMPAGARAYAVSVIAMTAGLGAGMAVLLLPLADLDVWTWRLIYVVPLLLLPRFLRAGRRLPESRRFTRPHGKATLAGHRGRLALLATASFFALIFLAPVAQFQNEYLRDEHSFRAFQITLFTLSTGTFGGVGIVLGGRLAAVRGRRVVGVIGTLGGALFFSAAYNAHGPALWVLTLCGTIIAAMTVPALGVYGPELFPTALRGRANGWISLAGVCGSAVGLQIAGRLADHLGRLGPGMALLALGPVVVALLVYFLYPETANIELETLNPEDAVGPPTVLP